MHSQVLKRSSVATSAEARLVRCSGKARSPNPSDAFALLLIRLEVGLANARRSGRCSKASSLLECSFSAVCQNLTWQYDGIIACDTCSRMAALAGFFHAQLAASNCARASSAADFFANACHNRSHSTKEGQYSILRHEDCQGQWNACCSCFMTSSSMNS